MEGSCSDGALWYEHLGSIQVSGVFHGSGVVAVVPVFDDRVKEFSKYLEGTVDRVKGVGLVSEVGEKQQQKNQKLTENNV